MCCWSLNLSHLADFVDGQLNLYDGLGEKVFSTEIYYHYYQPRREEKKNVCERRHRLNERFMVRIFSRRCFLADRGGRRKKRQNNEFARESWPKRIKLKSNARDKECRAMCVADAWKAMKSRWRGNLINSRELTRTNLMKFKAKFNENLFHTNSPLEDKPNV